MNITLTGGTGFLGRSLVGRLLSDGHHIHLIGRHSPGDLPPNVLFSEWPSASTEPPVGALQSADAIVHLAGEPVAQRWNDAVKRRIRSSRVGGTLQLVEALTALSRKPETLVCASAIGYYGDRSDEILTEDSPAGTGFLPELCVEWEKAADFAKALGIRVVQIRTGIVLGENGGALAKMLPPFRAGIGGKLGSGQQWMSWIQADDIIGIFHLALTNGTIHGPVNGSAPNPLTNADFTRELARALRRPAVFPVPEFALKALFGEMAQVLLSSQRVLPKAAEAAGYRFRFPTLALALGSLKL